MGQFFYFYKKLRHPDVIYSTHVSWVLACMLSRCMIKNSESCEILLRSFHSEGIFEGREEEPELFYALLCSELWKRWVFRSRKFLWISRFEWIISARACCTRKLLLFFHLSMLSRWGGWRPGIGGGFDSSHRPVVGTLTVLMAFLATFYWLLVAILTIHKCPGVGHLNRNS